MLSHETLSAALFTHWRDQFPLSVSTIYPDTALDTAAVSEWIELWINSWSRRPARATAPQWVDLVFTAHVFVKPTTDTARILELAEAARATISQQRIPVPDFQASGQPLLGYVSLLETETRDLTRSHRDAAHHMLHHLVLTTPGIAQPL